MSTELNTRELITRHFRRLKDNTMVMTKQLLVYGSRINVDNTTSFLVKTGMLKRLAWGLFIRGDMPDPRLEEIVRAKAKSFGRRIKEDAEEFAAKLERMEKNDDGVLEVCFATDGHSTSFLIGDIRIILRSESPRKFALKDSSAGNALRALWQIGKKYCSFETVEKFASFITPSDAYQLKILRPWMPNWLAENFSFARSNLRRDIFELINWSEQSDFVRRGIPHPNAYYLKIKPETV